MESLITPLTLSSLDTIKHNLGTSNKSRKYKNSIALRRINNRKHIQSDRSPVYARESHHNISSDDECNLKNNDNFNNLCIPKDEDHFSTSQNDLLNYNVNLRQRHYLLGSNIERISQNTPTTFLRNDTQFLSEPHDMKKLDFTKRKDNIHRSSHALTIKHFLFSNDYSSLQYIMIFVLFALGSIQLTNACNEAICASIVSKCTLLKSCECEITADGCPCCKTCFMCLDYLQTDCCSCVGLCPRPNNTAIIPPQKSKIMDFPEAVPSLWNALTEGDDVNDRWTSSKYPVDFTSSELTPYQLNQLHKVNKLNSVLPQQEENLSVLPNQSVITLNCTVTYLRQCMAENKCEKSCQSMGASQYRWFQNGCCECVGHNCKNYGINESKCSECGDDEEDDLNEDDLTDEELERMTAEVENEIQALN